MNNQVIIAAQKGDSAAFEYIYNQTYREGYAIAYSMLHDKSDAEDVLQEAYITLMQKISSLTDYEKFDSWFKRIVNNRCIDFMRKKKPVYFSSLFDDEEDEQAFENSDLFLDQSQNTESIVMDKADKDIISRIINSLPEDQRICILSFYYQDLSIKEIAENLNVSEATVKSRLKYGKEKINKAILEEEKKSGIKLHGIFALPLMDLFGNESLNIPAFDTLKSQMAFKGASKVASRVGKEVAKKTAGTVSKKIVSSILAITVLGSATAASFTVPINNGFTIAETILGESSYGISKDETIGLKTLLTVLHVGEFENISSANVGDAVLLWFHYFGQGTDESERFNIQYLLSIPSNQSVEGLCCAFNIEDIDSINVVGKLEMFLSKPIISLAQSLNVELPNDVPNIVIKDVQWNGQFGDVSYEINGDLNRVTIARNENSLFGISLITKQ